MRILVTGAGGHVGGAVLQRLYAEGHSLIALGRNPLPSLSPEIEMLQVDITSPDA
ncbi:MAG TPA: NAD-dependent epimerase/dehydratase family protein, partial [Candidatus Hydrogenedentes bacterium]|nr:NAD-dependent epimerase/dehydratase family protein [Candidatus Hydrogenedentota bacterium]